MTTCYTLFVVYFVLCISTLFWTVTLNVFVRCFEKVFPRVHETAAYLLLCCERDFCQVQTSLGSELRCFVKFSFWLSWELWSQGLLDHTGSPFLEPAVKNETTENKAVYLTCTLKCHGDLTFSHNFHSWQLSSNVLQNRSKRLEKVHVVLGNKPCDLDSLISTLAYAYFLDKVMENLDWIVLIHLFQVVTDILLLSQLL